MRGCFTCRFRPRGNGEGGGSSVHSNHAPVLQLPLLDAEVRTGEGFSYMFAADAFIDPDDAPLTYAATLEEGLDLPSWLTFDSPPPPRVQRHAPDEAGTFNVVVHPPRLPSLSIAARRC